MSFRDIIASIQFTAAEAVAGAHCLFRGNQGPSNTDAYLMPLEQRVFFSASPLPVEMAEELPDSGSTSEGIASQESKSDLSTSESVADESATAQQASRELVFVDTGTQNYQELVDDLVGAAEDGREFEVVLLDRSENGIEKISQVLSERNNLDAIHLVSHGDGRGIQLGSTRLDVDTAAGYAGGIASWASSLDANADLLIYSTLR